MRDDLQSLRSAALSRLRRLLRGRNQLRQKKRRRTRIPAELFEFGS
jgi:hypothetical protein